MPKRLGDELERYQGSPLWRALPSRGTKERGGRKHALRYYFLFLVASRCGLRLTECFGLERIGFKPDTRTLNIERQLREGLLIDRTKSDKVRTIPISTTVVEAA